MYMHSNFERQRSVPEGTKPIKDWCWLRSFRSQYKLPKEYVNWLLNSYRP